MSEEWGPWQEHDGRGCPCVGQYVQWERDADYISPVGTSGKGGRIVAIRVGEGIAQEGGSWLWLPEYVRIIRFRIRKPRGLTILENLIADLPAPVGPKVDA